MNNLSFRTRQICFAVSFAALLGCSVLLLLCGAVDKSVFYAWNITMLLFALMRFVEVRRAMKKMEQEPSGADE